MLSARVREWPQLPLSSDRADTESFLFTNGFGSDCLIVFDAENTAVNMTIEHKLIVYDHAVTEMRVTLDIQACRLKSIIK